MNQFKLDTNYINHDNKPPTYICQDCGLHYTHFNNHMIIIKEELWLSIADKKDVLCDHCIEQRLKRRLKISDLWRNDSNIISGINDWFINYLNTAINEKI